MFDDHYSSCRDTVNVPLPVKDESYPGARVVGYIDHAEPRREYFHTEPHRPISQKAIALFESSMNRDKPLGEPKRKFSETRGLVAQEERRMWEVLVPTVRPGTGGEKFFKTRYHRLWDEKVRAISGGLTVLNPVKGQWVSPSGELFRERMIPVRVIATREEIDKVVQLVIDHYDQEAVLAYEISSEVILKFRDK